MRGIDRATGSLSSHFDLEERVPARHPLRLIRRIVNDALAGLDAEFAALHTDFGRPPIAPERLIRASLIRILFPIRITPEASLRHDAAADGANGPQPAVPAVRRLGIDDPVWGEGRLEICPVVRFQP